MESTLVYLLVFSTITSLVAYVTYMKRGPVGTAPKYIGWTTGITLFSYWVVAGTGLFTHRDYSTNWPVALIFVAGVGAVTSLVIAAILKK